MQLAASRASATNLLDAVAAELTVAPPLQSTSPVAQSNDEVT